VHPLLRYKLQLIGVFEAFLRTLSPLGLILGTLCFAMALTPSLVPRPPLLQGLLCGAGFAIGYGTAMLGRALWLWLELPTLTGRPRWVLKGVLAAICLVVAVSFLAKASTWQNELRALMGLAPVEGTRPLQVAGIAALTFLSLLLLTRTFVFCARLVAAWTRRHLPRRIALGLGLLATGALFWSVAEGLLVRQVFRTFDASFARLDALIEDDTAPPADPGRTGSAASVVRWEDIGRQGRRHLSGGPDAAALARYGGQIAPVRVYIGLNAAERIEQRVDLAMAELLRAGAFERRVLVVITPTGTGWVDPGAIDSLEYLHRGDVASVAVQYSYLPSWLTLLTRPEHGAETARALFRAVHDHWRSLPPATRPKLYLHGLSLGALSAEGALDAWDLLADPIDGAVWSGPPYRAATWRDITTAREPDSPAWLPRFRDGSVVRFANQWQPAGTDGWGPVRIVYLQYASDPVTFFDPAMAWREPEWMQNPRGRDVSPALRWFPMVTMLQVAADVAAAEEAPIGHGHAYAFADYLDAWLAVTAPAGWDAASLAALKTEGTRGERP